jgi:oxalate decarboxylase/phosphoglucose isomerase-like protein (cupin superfamily)
MATARKPADAKTLEAELERNCKSFASRTPNWRVFALETKLDPRYARAQRRYVGASGSVTHADTEALPAVAHTLSIMEMPEGHHQPFHHHEEDEIFFVLDGACTVMWQEGDTIVEHRLGKWDMANNPSGRIHAIRNDGPGPVFFQVMLASPKPARPQYEDERLIALQRADDPDRK